MQPLLPSAVRRAIDTFASLPGIGPKSAQRLTFTMLKRTQDELDRFASAIGELKRATVFCTTCHTIAEEDPCTTCSDPNRDRSQLCIVEEVLDVVAIDSTNRYKGLYHVLGGAISPIDNISPEELTIPHLERRVKEAGPQLKELIFAMNPSTEGEATVLYISKLLGQYELKMTRLARGLPTGGDLEYADYLTLVQAFEGRRDITA